MPAAAPLPLPDPDQDRSGHARPRPLRPDPPRGAERAPAERKWSTHADTWLCLQARNGSDAALDRLVRRYRGFVRLKASAYFLAGGEVDDLVQEGLIGLYKAIRDFRPDREASFRSFAELCITRQVITAVKSATRNKHRPLNGYVSFSHTPAGQHDEGSATVGDLLPGPGTDDPSVASASAEDLRRLVHCIHNHLSELEARVLERYLAGWSYDRIAEVCDVEPKAVDNALQRIKRKVAGALAGDPEPRTRRRPPPAAA